MADEKSAKPAAPAAGAGGEEEGKKSNLVLVIGIIAGIVLFQAALAYLIIPKPVDEAKLAERAVQDSIRRAEVAAQRMGAVTADIPIEATVNIAGTDGERFLKAAIIIEYDEKNKQIGDELRNRAPRHKDLMINHLSSLTLMEVTEPGAKDKIRADLQRMINATLPSSVGEVNNVLFTTFIIQ